MTTDKIILGVGAPILDLLINVDDKFINGIEGDKGGMALVTHDGMDAIITSSGAVPVKVPGGSAGNTIFGLAKLGDKTSFLGKVGRDDDGEFYIRRLVELGGESRNFLYSDNVYTGRCLSLITPDSERTMRTDLGAAADIRPDEIHHHMFDGISHVHIEGYAMFAEDYFMRVLECAKDCGCAISLDLASFEVVRIKRRLLEHVLPDFINVVFSNEIEAETFFGKMSPEEHALKFNELCPVACVKLGKEGCRIATEGRVVSIGTPPVNAVDTTGAGDLWQAGFLHGYLRGLDIETCGRYGSILGSEVVQVIGAEIPGQRWSHIHQQLGK